MRAMSAPIAIQSLDQAVRALQHGELCIYPTETFYALGCDAGNRMAVQHLLQLKTRSPKQGMPVLIGAEEQLSLAVDTATLESGNPPLFMDALRSIMRRFWPGPLSLLLPASKNLAPGVAGANGLVALRLTPHPVARQLCNALNAPLVATSANPHGEPPRTSALELDPGLVELVGCVAPLQADAPLPAGGRPSTLARPFMLEGRVCVGILRHGAVSVQTLGDLGLRVVDEGTGI